MTPDDIRLHALEAGFYGYVPTSEKEFLDRFKRWQDLFDSLDKISIRRRDHSEAITAEEQAAVDFIRSSEILNLVVQAEKSIADQIYEVRGWKEVEDGK